MESSRPIEALSSVPSRAEKFDLSIQDGPEPDWVRAILSLPGKILKHKQEPAEAAEPSFVLTQYGEEAGYELAYSDGTRFVTDGAATLLWGTYQPPMAAEEMAVYLLGPVMGFLLRRRHITCLHSSCVEVQGHAICLCGEAGSENPPRPRRWLCADFRLWRRTLCAWRKQANDLWPSPVTREFVSGQRACRCCWGARMPCR